MTYDFLLNIYTPEERIEQRQLSRARFAHVNKALRALYIERDRIAAELKEREDERDGQAD